MQGAGIPMRNVDGAAAYREARVLGRTPEQLVVLLYEHLLTCLRRAQAQMPEGDIEARGQNLERASDIVFELLSSLDREAGGEIASRLAALYAYFVGEISALGLKPDRGRAERLIGLIAGLHESWARAAGTAPAMTAGAGGAP
jgi:flagellar protein FliS